MLVRSTGKRMSHKGDPNGNHHRAGVTGMPGRPHCVELGRRHLGFPMRTGASGRREAPRPCRYSQDVPPGVAGPGVSLRFIGCVGRPQQQGNSDCGPMTRSAAKLGPVDPSSC